MMSQDLLISSAPDGIRNNHKHNQTIIWNKAQTTRKALPLHRQRNSARNWIKSFRTCAEIPTLTTLVNARRCILSDPVVNAHSP